jgi:hypothetical protein
LLFNCGAVSLRCPASEVLYVKTGHEKSYRRLIFGCEMVTLGVPSEWALPASSKGSNHEGHEGTQRESQYSYWDVPAGMYQAKLAAILTNPPQFKWAGNQEAVTLPWLSAHSILSWIGGDISMVGLIEWKSSSVSAI